MRACLDTDAAWYTALAERCARLPGEHWRRLFALKSAPYAGADSHVDVRRPQRIALDEVAPRLDLVAHQHREHVVGLDGVVDLHAQQAAHGGVHRGLPELLRVHLAQALVALAA